MCDTYLELEQKENERQAKEIAEAGEGSTPGGTYLATSYGKKSAQKNLAKVHRAEWEDYMSRFAPVEDELFSHFNDAEGRAAAVEQAGMRMKGAFDQSKAQTGRELSRYGLNPSARQQEQQNRSSNVRQALAVSGAKNTTRRAKEDQRMAIAGGGLNSVAQRRK